MKGIPQLFHFTAFEEIVLNFIIQLCGSEVLKHLVEEKDIVCIGHSVGDLAAQVFVGLTSTQQALDIAFEVARIVESNKRDRLRARNASRSKDHSTLITSYW